MVNFNVTFNSETAHLSQILSRVMSQPTVDGNYLVNNIKKKKSPQFEDYLNQRDYLGAITLLEVTLMFSVITLSESSHNIQTGSPQHPCGEALV